MLKKILIISIIIIGIIFTISTIKISTNKVIPHQIITKEIPSLIDKNFINKGIYKQQKNIKKEAAIGSIIIEKINLNESLYEINSKENTVDKHVTILQESILPDKENSILFLAAHSGKGKIAFFDNLNKLEENDEVTIILHNIKYNYFIKNIWEQKKDGFINVTKNLDNQLILTTCSKKSKDLQLVINCIQK